MATATKEMKKTVQCTVNRGDFLIGLNLCASVAPGRVIKPILACCKLYKDDRGLRIAATDLEVWASYKTNQVEIDEWPDIAAPVAELRAIVAGMTGDTVQLSIEGEHLRICAGGSSFKLYTQDVSAFPPRPEMQEDAVEATIGGAELARMIRQTRWAVADNASRYAMSGILFEGTKKGLATCATEGHVLATTSVPLKISPVKSIVPDKAIGVIAKALEGVDDDVFLRLHANRVAVVIDDVEIHSTCVEGNFPPYEDVIPKDITTVVKINKDDLLAAVKNSCVVLATIAAQGGDSLRFKFESKGLKISGMSPGKGECDIFVPAKSDNQKMMEIGLNPKFLRELLQACECEEVKLSLSAPNRPIMAEDGKSTFICMPCNLNN